MRTMPLKAPSAKRYAKLCFPSSWRRKRAHIMGVVVSETTMETAMATVSVTANSRKRRPTIPGKRRMGMKTATSEALMERTVKPISLAPCMVAANGFIPPSMWRGIFLVNTKAASTTKPREMGGAVGGGFWGVWAEGEMEAEGAKSGGG